MQDLKNGHLIKKVFLLYNHFRSFSYFLFISSDFWSNFEEIDLRNAKSLKKFLNQIKHNPILFQYLNGESRSGSQMFWI